VLFIIILIFSYSQIVACVKTTLRISSVSVYTHK